MILIITQCIKVTLSIIALIYIYIYIYIYNYIYIYTHLFKLRVIDEHVDALWFKVMRTIYIYIMYILVLCLNDA
jgi:hypothetical protein